MIYKFNREVFSSTDSEAQFVIAKLIGYFIDGRFLWDLANLTEVYDNDEFPFEETETFNYLSDPLKANLGDILDGILQLSSYITQPQLHYFRTISVGFAEAEVKPSDVLRIIEQPSMIFLENLTNDWNFIRGVIDNYAKHKLQRSVFGKLKDAYESYRIIPIGVGGGGEFAKYIKTFYDGFYRGIGRQKVIAVFDSDRENHTAINDKWYNLLKYLKNGRDFELTNSDEWHFNESDLILWHMLYKREQENYIPKDMLLAFESLPNEARQEIENMTPEEFDFFNFGGYLDSFKNETSKFFLEIPIREALEERCAHHKISVETPTGILEDVSELNKILQMIVKIL